MKKILITASAGSHIKNFHLPYVKYFKEIGYEIHTASGGKVYSPYIDKTFNLSFDKRQLSIKNAITIMKLAALMRKERYDIVSSNATLAGLLTRMAVVISGTKPTVIHMSHGYLFKDDETTKSRIYLGFEKLLAKHTDLLFTMNGEDYNIACKHDLCQKIEFIHGCGLCREKLPWLTPNEVDDVQKFYGITDIDTVLLCVGEFSERKNQAMLLRAFSGIVKKKVSVKLLLAGDGKLLLTCKQLVKKLKIEDNVIFCGQVDKVSTLYCVADIVVSASISEGLPFNILEALHYGIPVVASNVKGHVDLIANHVNGLLFDLESESELESCLRLLIDDTKLYNNIKSHVSLQNEYYIDRVQQEILGLYSTIGG